MMLDLLIEKVISGDGQRMRFITQDELAGKQYAANDIVQIIGRRGAIAAQKSAGTTSLEILEQVN